jgi:Fe-S-cluster-containing hydrogenase component 2
MEAIEVEDAIAKIDLTKCIGCGVCAPTCTSEAIKLRKKDEEVLPPRNTLATYMTIMDKKAEIARENKN